VGELRDAEPIKFDAGAAEDLAAKFTATANLLRSQVSQRNALASVARMDWKGSYEVKFGERMAVCAEDAGLLAGALDRAAKQVGDLTARAENEQDRRTKAREWKVDHDAWRRRQEDKSALDHIGDFLSGSSGEPEPPEPNLTPDNEPNLPVAAPPPKSRA
jgi:uncharacterized protein YukE